MPFRNKNQLYRLTYVSTIAIAAEDVHTQVMNIVRGSRDRNKHDHVTGALTYIKQYFFQILEGPEAAVRATFARISADSRHSAVRMLNEAHVPRRLFEQWSLEFAQFNSADAQICHDVLNSPDEITPSDILRLENLLVKWSIEV